MSNEMPQREIAPATRVLAGLLSLMLVSPPNLLAQVVTDPNAPLKFQPRVKHSTAGVPVVDIVSPTAGGVSHNKFERYDVDAVGLILNNSQSGGTATLGGQVAGNSNLKNGSAAIIVNEVTSSRASSLAGSTEVLGKQADVVVANPNGISCSGCSFVNANGVVLTTGTPTAVGSGVDLSVSGGRVEIQGQGLSGANKTALIAERVVIDAPVNAAQQIQVQAGNGQYRYQGGVSSLTSGAAASGNAKGIDATAFGALQSGRIEILATGDGVGVKSDAYLAANADDLFISADGDVDIRGAEAVSKIEVQSKEDVVVRGDLYADQSIAISGQSVSSSANTAVEAYAGSVELNATKDVQSDSQIRAGSRVDITASQDIGGSFDAVSPEAVSISANRNIQLNDGVIVADEVIVAGDGDIATSNEVLYGNDVRIGGGAVQLGRGSEVRSPRGRVLIVSDSDVDNAGTVDGVVVDVVANKALRNQADSLMTADTLTTITGSVNNSGYLASAFVLDVSTDYFENDGAISAFGTASLQSTGDLSSSGSISAGRLALGAGGDLKVSGHLLSASDLEAVAAGEFRLENAGVLVDASAAIAAANGITIQAAELDVSAALVLTTEGALSVQNSLLSSGQETFLTGNDIQMSGQIISDGDFYAAAASDFQNNAVVASAGKITALSGSLFANNGVLAAAGTAQVVANELTNAGSIVGGPDVSIDAHQSVANTGLIVSSGATALHTGALSNTDGGTLSAEDALSVLAHSIENLNDGLLVADDIELNAKTFLNGATVASSNKQSIDVEDFFNTTEGVLQSNGNLHLIASDKANNLGELGAAGQFTITSTSFGNAGLVSANQLQLDVRKLYNVKGDKGAGRILANELSLPRLKTLLNNGSIVTSTDIKLALAELNNVGGLLEAGRLDLEIAGEINNKDGALSADQLSISAGSVLNSSGDSIIYGGQFAQLEVAGGFTNNGQVISNGAALLSAGQELTNNGLIETGGALDIGAAGAVNNTGILNSLGVLKIQSASLENKGSIDAPQIAIILDADITNADETLGNTQASDLLYLETKGDFLSQGEWVEVVTEQGGGYSTSQLHWVPKGVHTSGDLIVKAAGNITNSAGHITADGNLILQAKGDFLNQSEIRDNITAKGVNTTERLSVHRIAGTTYKKNLKDVTTATAMTKEVADGLAKVEAGGRLDIAVKGDVDNQGGKINANGPVQIEAGGSITNSLVSNNFASYATSVTRDAFERFSWLPNPKALARVYEKHTADYQNQVLQGAFHSDADLALIAGGDIRNAGASLSAAGNVHLAAEGDVSNTVQTDAATESVTRRATGWFNKLNRVEKLSSQTVKKAVHTHHANITAGKDLSITSGGAITNSGARLEAQGNALLVAEGSIANKDHKATLTSKNTNSWQQKFYVGGRAYYYRPVSATTETQRVSSESAFTVDGSALISAGQGFTNSDTQLNAGSLGVEASGDITISGIKGGIDVADSRSLSAGSNLHIEAAQEDVYVNLTGTEVALKGTRGYLALSAGNDVDLQAGADIAVLESSIDAGNNLRVWSGGDLRAETFTYSEAPLYLAGSLDYATTEPTAISRSDTSGYLGGVSPISGTQAFGPAKARQASLAAGNDFSLQIAGDLDLISAEIKANNDLGLAIGGDLRLVSRAAPALTSVTEFVETSAGYRPTTANKLLYVKENFTGEIKEYAPLASLASLTAGNNIRLDISGDLHSYAGQIEAGESLSLDVHGDLNNAGFHYDYRDALIKGKHTTEKRSWLKRLSWNGARWATTYQYLGKQTASKDVYQNSYSEAYIPGLFSAGQQLWASVGGSLNNQSGDFLSGGDTTLVAAVDLNLGDGHISAVDNVVLSARDIKLHNTVSTQEAFGRWDGETKTSEGRGLVSSAAGDISLLATRNIELGDIELSAGGSLYLQADGRVEFGIKIPIASAPSQTAAPDLNSANWYSSLLANALKKPSPVSSPNNEPVISKLHAADHVQITAGNDFNVANVEITSAGTLALDSGADLSVTDAQIAAVGDISITGVDVTLAPRMQQQAGVQIKTPDALAGKTPWVPTATSNRIVGDVDIVSTEGSIAIIADHDAHVDAARLSAANSIEIHAGENVSVGSLKETASGSGWGADFSLSSHYGSQLAAKENIVLNAGNNLNVNGALLNAENDIALYAKGETTIESEKDRVYYYKYRKEGGGLETERVYQTLRILEAAAPAQLVAGGDVLINVHKDSDGNLAKVESGDVNVLGSEVLAGRNVVVAGDSIALSAIAYVDHSKETKEKTRVGGLSQSAELTSEQRMLLESAKVAAVDGSVNLLADADLAIIAADVHAGDQVNISAAGNALVSSGNTYLDRQSWKKKSKFNLGAFITGTLFSGLGLFGGDLFSLTETASGLGTATAQASNITAEGFSLDAGRATVIGSDIRTGSDGIRINTDIGDIQVLAAEEKVDSFSYYRDIQVSAFNFADFVSNAAQYDQSGDGQAKLTIGEATYEEVEQRQKDILKRASSLISDGHIGLRSIGDITVTGSTIVADADANGHGNLALQADGDIRIEEATNLHSTLYKKTTGKGEVSIVVQQQGVEVAKAIIALKESKEGLKEAKEAYNKYKKDRTKLKGRLVQLEAAYAAREPGVSLGDVRELRDIIEDMESDEEWYKAGIAAAVLHVASQTTLVAQQTAALVQSAGSYAWGFNAGIQLDIEASKTKTETNATSSLASQLSGNNILLQSGLDGDVADSSVTMQGSHIQAANGVQIDTGVLDVLASRDTYSSSTSTEQGSVSVGMTIYGNGSPTINASYSRSKDRNNQTIYTNSTITGDVIAINTAGDATLRGANVHAHSALIANVGGDLTVESQQNRSSGSGSSFGLSAGLSFGADTSELVSRGNRAARTANALNVVGQTLEGQAGAIAKGNVSGVNFGVNGSSHASSSRQTVVSSLTSGGSADINVGGTTQLIGATLATINSEGQDLGKLTLRTGRLDYEDLRNTNYSRNTSAAFSSSVSVGGSQEASAAGSGGTGQAAANPAATAQTPQTTPAQPETGKEQEANPLSAVGTTSIAYSNGSSYEVTKTLATLGQGDIQIADTEGTDLDRLNRNVAVTSRNLFAVDRQRGDIDLKLDVRLLHKDGQKQIREDFRRSAILGKSVVDALLEESVAFLARDPKRTNISQHLFVENAYFNVSNKLGAAFSDTEERKAMFAAFLRGEGTVAQKTEVYNQVNALIAAELGITPAEARILLSDKIRGAKALYSDEAGNKIFLVDDQNLTTGDALNSIGNENSDYLDNVLNGPAAGRGADYRVLRDEYSELVGDSLLGYAESSLKYQGFGGLDAVNQGIGATAENKHIQESSAIAATLDFSRIQFRQFNQYETNDLQKVAREFAQELGEGDEKVALKRLARQRLREVDDNWDLAFEARGYGHDPQASGLLAILARSDGYEDLLADFSETEKNAYLARTEGYESTFVEATREERENSELNAEYAGRPQGGKHLSGAGFYREAIFDDEAIARLDNRWRLESEVRFSAYAIGLYAGTAEPVVDSVVDGIRAEYRRGLNNGDGKLVAGLDTGLKTTGRFVSFLWGQVGSLYKAPAEFGDSIGDAVNNIDDRAAASRVVDFYTAFAPNSPELSELAGRVKAGELMERVGPVATVAAAPLARVVPRIRAPESNRTVMVPEGPNGSNEGRADGVNDQYAGQREMDQAGPDGEAQAWENAGYSSSGLEGNAHTAPAGPASDTDIATSGVAEGLPEFDGTSYTKAQYDAYVARKRAAGETPKDPADYVTARQLRDRNNAAHEAAATDAQAKLQANGFDVHKEVTMDNIDTGVRSRADLTISSLGNASSAVPDGFKAYDLDGNELSEIPLDGNGRAIVEIKTGNADLTENQIDCYGAACSAGGNVQGAGANADAAGLDGQRMPNSVLILRADP